MADTRKYLDYEGLKAYTSKILELIAKKADQSVLEQEIQALNDMIGDTTQLKDYENIVDALLAEIERAKEAESALTSSFDWGTLGQ